MAYKEVQLKDAQRGDIMHIGNNRHKVLSNFPEHRKIVIEGWVNNEATYDYDFLIEFHYHGIWRDMSARAQIKRWLVNFVRSL